MLTINNLSLSFKDNQVLKNLNLTIQKGVINGIVGLNGSGKTTLLNTVCQHLKQQQGEILWENKPVNIQQIAYLETNNFFYNRMTGSEYLHFFLQNNTDFNLSEWNTIFDLPLNNYVTSYSTGMKKKLAFLGILSLNRPILILDEPFNGLDLETNEVIKQIIRRLQQTGKTIIVTSHILETLTTICSEIHYLNDGNIQATYNSDTYNQLSKVFENLQTGTLEGLIKQL
ncbi:MAG: ATP-binding cassette domain-containing protein [Saprospiraceae bacterium]